MVKEREGALYGAEVAFEYKKQILRQVHMCSRLAKTI